MDTTISQTAALTIEPWLEVNNGDAAVAFYKSAFDAMESYRMETPDGLVAKLSVGNAVFWISGGTSNDTAVTPEQVPVRMIMTVSDPDAAFAKALAAGATEIFPVGEDFGWRLGRLSDPFGHHWEIGKQLAH